MNRLLRPLSPVSWPIWLKLTTLVASILLFVLLIAYLLLVNLQEVDRENLENYLLEQGASQRVAIADVLRSAREAVTAYVNNPTYSRVLNNTLLAAAPIDPVPPQQSPEDLRQMLEVTLVETGLFSEVRLLTLNGILVAGAGNVSPNPVAGGQNESDSESFHAAENARLLGRSQDLIVYGRSVAKIDIVQVLFLLDGTPAGYLVVTLNTSETIFPILERETAQTYIESFSYLVRRNSTPPLFFTLRETRARSEVSILMPQVERALDGLRELGSIDSYGYTAEVPEYDEENNEIRVVRDLSVLGYYTTIPDTDLVLIVETESNSTFSATLEGLMKGNTIFVIAIGAAAMTLILIAFYNQLFTQPIQSLRQALRSMSTGNFTEPVSASNRLDEFGQLAITFLDTREQVSNLIEGLEERVRARGRDIQATQEISRFAATQRDIQTLMDRVVHLIVDYFPNIYHAQIFLIDDDKHYAVLRASTGEPGRKLLERGHRLAVGSLSVIGRVTEQGQFVVARDVASSEVHRRNEFLPDTRSELAVPLRIGANIIGALDVQSKKSDAFPEDEVSVLQTMADQIAVAIENANLYQESVRSLAEIERSRRMTTLRDWEDYMQMERVREYSTESGIKTDLDLSELRRIAMAQNRTVVGDPSPRNTVGLAVPITLRGQVLGAAAWELPISDFGEDKVLLAQQLVSRLAVSMENARLFQQSQLATERERLVNTITARLTSKQDINDILQTALREVGQALRAPEVSIKMHWSGGETPPPPAVIPPTNGNHSNGSTDLTVVD